jgi:hypothetical protein
MTAISDAGHQINTEAIDHLFRRCPPRISLNCRDAVLVSLAPWVVFLAAMEALLTLFAIRRPSVSFDVVLHSFIGGLPGVR